MAANNEDGIVTKICYICGSMNSTVTCQQCNKMLCISCDRLYHSHPTRTKHIRNIKDTHQVKVKGRLQIVQHVEQNNYS